MSRSIVIFAVAALSAGLVGCAATPDPTYRAQRFEPSKQEVDSDRVSAINAIARKRGVGVHWVNPPTRRADPFAQN